MIVDNTMESNPFTLVLIEAIQILADKNIRPSEYGKCSESVDDAVCEAWMNVLDLDNGRKGVCIAFSAIMDLQTILTDYATPEQLEVLVRKSAIPRRLIDKQLKTLHAAA